MPAQKPASSEEKPLIVFLFPALPESPRTGGEIYNRHVLDGLSALGFDVQILALDQMVDIASLRRRRGRQRAGRAIVQALRGICDGTPDPDSPKPVVIYDSWLYRCLWTRMPGLRLRGVCDLVSFSQLCYWDTYRSPFHRAMHRLMTMAALAPAHRHVGVSRAVLKADLGPLSRLSRCTTIYPGCDYVGQTLPQAQCDALPAQILSVGNYAPRKGFHILIEALGAAVRLCPELRGKVTLRFAGNRSFDPDYFQRLKELVEANGLGNAVTLDDWKDRRGISRLLSESQLFAFASDSEGFGMVVLEAMLHGLPALLGDFMTAQELVGESGDCGYVVHRRDAGAFAEALVDFFTRRDRGSMGRAARKRALALGHTWSEVADRFAEVACNRSNSRSHRAAECDT